ncbi:MAG: ribonuclease R [Firmicutes bacterium]|nr:ribonuclease R [Bacillota bacterium]
MKKKNNSTTKIKYQRKNKRQDKPSYKSLEADNKIVFKGVLQGNSKGFAFLLPEFSAKDSFKDIFIAPRNLGGAFNNDTVLVRLIEKANEESDEGEVIEVLKRGNEVIVGTYEDSKNFGFVIPDDKKFYRDIYIKSNGLKAKTGQKVVAKITLYHKDGAKPEGEIIEILGYNKEPETEVLSVIRAHNLYEEFEAEVEKAAKQVPSVITFDEISKREDLRDITTVTIDGFDAKDLDDAISISNNPDGSFKLGVHIADVSHYVSENSVIDEEALKRGTSVYFPDRTYPMLPKELSNGICSLNPKVDRLTLSAFMDVDFKGDVLSYKICKSVIRTAERLTYDSVTKILEKDEVETGKYRHILSDIFNFEKLAKILIEKRRIRGSLDLDLPEFKVLIGDNHEVIDIIPYPRKISHRIIEEFMILANETVAKYITDEKLPFVYRIHEKPDIEKVEGFKKFLTGLNLSLGGKSESMRPKDYAKLIAKIENEPYFYVVNRTMLRTLMKAKYSPVNLGHFGLASKCYCHFTSPIRRYPDLIVHRIIKMRLSGAVLPKKIDKLKRQVEFFSVQSSERERVAELAERDVDDYYKAKFMSKKIGLSFEGVISSIKEFGFFVELANTVEGLVRLETLPQDNYQYIESQIMLKGAKYKFNLGDKVKITVINVDMVLRKIDFKFEGFCIVADGLRVSN